MTVSRSFHWSTSSFSVVVVSVVTMGTYKVDPVVTLLSGLNNDCVKRSEVDLGKVMLKSCDGGSPPLFQVGFVAVFNNFVLDCVCV